MASHPLLAPTNILACFRRPDNINFFACKATNSDQNNPKSNRGQRRDERKILDRRNVLIGLGAGGLYGAAGGLVDPRGNPFALADPVVPDLSSCSKSTQESIGGLDSLNCCPPASTDITPFKPDSTTVTRTRPAAHLAACDLVYLEKYSRALALMKNLPLDDPRNFWNQAKVHCAYCDGGYKQVGFPKKELQVHFSWLFYPFHRWYLYFYEKILGHLIDDPTFALPFWNWDAPEGMTLPRIFEDVDKSTSPLYDRFRDAKHRQKDFLFDFSYSPKAPESDTPQDRDKIIQANLTRMHVQMCTKDKCAFFGQPYVADGKPSPGAGNIESVPHNLIHAWTGDRDWTGEDMGHFYSSGRDPAFYVHHANVDRMWHIWKTNEKLQGQDFEADDWKKAEFLLYDEHKNLRRVKVEDCVDPAKLGYGYQNVDIPWLDDKYRPTTGKPITVMKKKSQLVYPDAATKFPATLDSKISVKVARPIATKRTTEEKESQEELLVIRGIEFPANQGIGFDVYVNDEGYAIGADKAEFAGTFVNIPHGHSSKMKTNQFLAITRLLENIKAEEDSSVVVTLVPKYGEGPISIGGVSIELSTSPN